jgi:hypothetical protein
MAKGNFEYREVDTRDGLFQIRFNPRKHTYAVNGPGFDGWEWLPSVTGIGGVFDGGKSFGLKKWAVDLAVKVFEEWALDNDAGVSVALASKRMREANTRESERAARVGRDVHEWVEKFLSSGKVPRRPSSAKKPEVLGAIHSFEDWFHSGDGPHPGHKRTTLGTEVLVVHPSERFVGTLDWLWMEDGVVGVTDFKTSNRFYLSNIMQAVAYLTTVRNERAWCEHPKWRAEVLMLDKGGGEAELHVADGDDEIQAHWAAFLSCRYLFDWHRGDV